MFKSYNDCFFRAFLLGALILSVIFSGCKPTKFVPADYYLLNTVKIQVDKKGVKKEDLKSYVRQKPNKRIFGFWRFHLGLYNLSNIKNNNWFNKYLRKIGEEPVIWDPNLTKRTSKQLKLYFNKKGFYNAVVVDTFTKHKKYINIIYKVYENKPYRISNFRYVFEDSTAQGLILSDTIHSQIKQNGVFDEDMLQRERVRIESLLKNNGYYHFNRNYIVFAGDTDNMKVDLQLVIKKSISKKDTVIKTNNPYRQYKINRVVIVTEPDPLMDAHLKTQKRDTILKNGIEYIYQENFWVRPGVIQQANYIFPHTIFRVTDGEETKRHLSSINTFSLINVQYNEISAQDTSRFGYLDCFIKLTPLSIQSYSFTVEGTTSGGNLGGALNLTYQHKSLFGNAENLNLKFTGAMESLKNNENGHIRSKLELGVLATIQLPIFLMPFNNNQFIKKYDPKTLITAAYNYLQRPDYSSATVTGTFGYTWKQNSRISHIARPIDLNLFNLLYSSPSFTALIKNKAIENSFVTHFITATSYSVIFNNQNLKKAGDFHYLRWNIETAGNMMRFYNQLTKAPMAHSMNADSTENKNGYYSLFGIRFSQYIRSDIDYHYYQYINESNTVVYRLFAGIGKAYGNSLVMPYEKQYFSGGANSIRGWEAKRLGPGSYNDTISAYPNSTGDLKLEANVEYRFKLFWILEGALFTDVGNIWIINNQDTRKDAIFRFDKFYKDIAVGSGIGLRFLLGYFTGRIDFGVKMRNPTEAMNHRWLFLQRNFDFSKDKAISIGIAYPF